MLKFFLNKKYALAKEQKEIFQQLSITEKILLPTLLTTLLPTLLPTWLILLNGIVTIILLSLTLIDSLSYFKSYLKIVQWFKSVQFCNF